MPSKRDAQWWRDYRARKKADLAARATRPSSQDPRSYEPPIVEARCAACGRLHSACACPEFVEDLGFG